jgi:hypothetical protein
MRVEIHKQGETFGKNRTETYQEEVQDVIYTQLVALRINQRENDVYKIKL